MNTVRHKPHRAYWICFTPRTGSALLCQLLRATGVAGRPEEYFWRDNEPLYRVRWHVASYHDYLERALKEGTTPNGIFGAKVGAGMHLAHFFHQLRTLPQFEEAALSRGSILSALFPDLKCIWLTRRNKVRQAVSWWKAVQSDRWVQHTTEAPSTAPSLTYHFAAIDQLVNESLMQDAAWAECFAAWQIKPLTIVYEDVIDDYAGTVAHILRYLEVSDPYVFDETAITLMRQADSLSEEWVQQYREEKQHAGQTGHGEETAAQHGAAPDCLQPPLRCGFRQQVSCGVRPQPQGTNDKRHVVSCTIQNVLWRRATTPSLILHRFDHFFIVS